MEHNFGHLESSQKSGEGQVLNPFAAFAHGLIHSVENSYNGAAQLATGGNAAEVRLTRSADSDSGLAQTAYIAGEVVGTGAQILTIGKVLPHAKSIVGGVARSGAIGAFYGGVLQPSEGVNLGEERLKNGVAMGAFAGGLAGASHEATTNFLNGTDVTLAGMGSSMTKGALMGAAMEFGGTALVRTNLKNLASEGSYKSARQPVELKSLAHGPRDPHLLKTMRDSGKGGMKDPASGGDHHVPVNPKGKSAALAAGL